jgi:hypothetical protein
MDNCHFENITKLEKKKRKEKKALPYFNITLPRYLCNIHPIAIMNHAPMDEIPL